MIDLLFSLFAILAGCALLYVGGDMLVSASTLIADRIGMSAVAIGATVVAVGTSAPELSVSLGAAMQGHNDISVGNIVGSNICNIIFVLGLCGLVAQVRPSREIFRIDFPILIAMSALFTFMIRDHMISRIEGLILFTGLITYVVWNLRRAAEDEGLGEILSEEVASTLPEGGEGHWAGTILRATSGILMLALGAKWLVDGSLQALEPFQLSEATIGVTVVALGTSVPEIGTSMIAAKKGEGDLAVGNAIGSSVFNLLGVLGITASLSPLNAHDVSLLDGVILMLTSLAGMTLVARARGIGRPEGIVLILAYLAYVGAALSPQFN